MAKYVSFNTLTKVLGEADVQLLEGMGIIKRGSGSVLMISKDGVFTNAPIEAGDKVISYLKRKVTPTVPTKQEKKEITPTEVVAYNYLINAKEMKSTDPATIWVTLKNTVGNGVTKRSVKCWADLMERDGISPTEAFKVMKAVKIHTQQEPLTYAQKCKVREGISHFPESWFKRVCKTIEVSPER